MRRRTTTAFHTACVLPIEVEPRPHHVGHEAEPRRRGRVDQVRDDVVDGPPITERLPLPLRGIEILEVFDQPPVAPRAVFVVTRGLVGDTTFAVLPDVSPRTTFLLTLAAQIVSCHAHTIKASTDAPQPPLTKLFNHPTHPTSFQHHTSHSDSRISWNNTRWWKRRR